MEGRPRKFPDIRIAKPVEFPTATPKVMGYELTLIDRFRNQNSPPREPDTEYVYVDPIAPASGGEIDIDFSPEFENGWGNIAGEQPMGFYLDEVGDVIIEGGFEGGSPPSVMFTLPLGFRPRFSKRFNYPKDDSGTTGAGRVDPNGEVWILS